MDSYFEVMSNQDISGKIKGIFMEKKKYIHLRTKRKLASVSHRAKGWDSWRQAGSVKIMITAPISCIVQTHAQTAVMNVE